MLNLDCILSFCVYSSDSENYRPFPDLSGFVRALQYKEVVGSGAFKTVYLPSLSSAVYAVISITSFLDFRLSFREIIKIQP
jgi:hypothetical protein